MLITFESDVSTVFRTWRKVGSSASELHLISIAGCLLKFLLEAYGEDSWAAFRSWCMIRNRIGGAAFSVLLASRFSSRSLEAVGRAVLNGLVRAEAETDGEFCSNFLSEEPVQLP